MEGWICAKCGRVYSPSTAMCAYCGPEIPVATSTGGSTDVRCPRTVERCPSCGQARWDIPQSHCPAGWHTNTWTR